MVMVVAHREVHQIQNQKKNKRKEEKKMNLRNYNWFGLSVEGIHGIQHW